MSQNEDCDSVDAQADDQGDPGHLAVATDGNEDGGLVSSPSIEGTPFPRSSVEDEADILTNGRPRRSDQRSCSNHGQERTQERTSG